jgi:hypothetical protein
MLVWEVELDDWLASGSDGDGDHFGAVVDGDIVRMGGHLFWLLGMLRCHPFGAYVSRHKRILIFRMAALSSRLSLHDSPSQSYSYRDSTTLA